MKSFLARLWKICPPELRCIIAIASKVAQKCKVKLWLVGGPVRDLILGKKIYDLDFLVDKEIKKFVISLSKELKANYHFTDFLTAKINYNIPIDVNQTRKEIYPSPGALPLVSAGSFMDDIYRRDFTINALALQIINGKFGELVDYLSGFNDIKDRLIRLIKEDGFIEDPTRIIRAIIYEQRFGFQFEKKTLLLLRKAICSHAFSLVTPQRLAKVLRKALLEKKAGAVIIRICELAGIDFLIPNFKLKPEIKTLLQNWDNFSKRREIKEGYLLPLLTLIEHLDTLSPSLITALQLRRQEKDILDNFIKLDKGKLTKKLASCLSPLEIYVNLKDIPLIVIIYLYLKASGRARENFAYYIDKLSKIQIRINGEDLKKLGMKEGREIGNILQEVLYARVAGKAMTRAQQLKYAYMIACKKGLI